jgi:hypothetical protein
VPCHCIRSSRPMRCNAARNSGVAS